VSKNDAEENEADNPYANLLTMSNEMALEVTKIADNFGSDINMCAKIVIFIRVPDPLQNPVIEYADSTKSDNGQSDNNQTVIETTLCIALPSLEPNSGITQPTKHRK